MRYTEARLDGLADEMMEDLDKETVDFVPELRRDHRGADSPSCALPEPARERLCGIAVGMATNIPPHNMEVIDAAIWLIESSQADEQPTLPGETAQAARTRARSDPTGGYIVGRQDPAGLPDRPARVMRAKAEIEVSKKGDRSSIVIDAILPGQREADRAHCGARPEKVLEGISDIRDESDRDGLRIVIDLKRGEVGEVIPTTSTSTQLQTTFGVIMLAIVGGRPQVLSLLEVLDNFIEFRARSFGRTEFELEGRGAPAHPRRAEDRAGSSGRGDRADQGSANPAIAREGLITQFGLSQIQAQAILDMQLQRLTGLEREDPERAGRVAQADRAAARDSEQRQARDADRRRRAAQVQAEYGDLPRTEILADEGEFRIEDLIAEEDMAITVSNTGYIKRTAITNYRNQRRQRPHRHADARGGLRQPSVRRLEPRLAIFSDRGRAHAG